MEVKFRVVNPRLAPRRTKVEMPGWAGKPEPRTDGAQEYAWHCAPFTEGAQQGIEIFYMNSQQLGEFLHSEAARFSSLLAHSRVKGTSQ